MSKKLVSIILLTWNGSSHVEECLDSVMRQRYRPLELIVVDNGSTDGTSDMIQTCLHEKMTIPWKIELLPFNTGFAKGMNRGIAHSNGKYTLTLNQDLKMEEDYISNLVEGLEKEGGTPVGSAIGKILKWNKDNINSGSIIDSAGHEIFSDRIVEDRGKGKSADSFADPCAVFGVSAVAALYDRDTLERVSLKGEIFDNDFFSYLEDVDLDYRLILKGYESRYVPSAIAYHAGAGSGGRKSFRIRFKAHTNRYLVWIKNEKASEFLKDLAPILVQEIFQLFRTLVTSPLLLLSWFVFPSKAMRVAKKGREIYREEEKEYRRLRSFIKRGRLMSKFMGKA